MLPIHLIFLGFSIVVMFLADKEAFLWFTGKKSLLNKTQINLYHNLVWIGLSGMILTGAIMAWPAREYLLQVPLFLVKMSFVVALVINGFIIGKLKNLPAEKSYFSLKPDEKLPLFISGAISITGWLGAAITAIVLFDF